MCHQMYQGTSFQPFSGVLSRMPYNYFWVEQKPISFWTLDKFSDDQQLDLVKYVVLWHHQSLNLFLKETIDDLG